MKKSIGSMFLLFVLITVLIMSGCAPAPTPEPTSTPVPPTFTPIPPTFTPEPTATATTTPLPTPVTECSPYAIIKTEANNSLPGYIDIMSVSSVLEGTKLTVIFELREIPEVITVDQDKVEKGKYEIAYGVGIDIDADTKTGISAFVINSGLGYDVVFQANYWKQQDLERSESIEAVFEKFTFIWSWVPEKNQLSTTSTTGITKVDFDAKTLTIEDDIEGITPNAYLHFFTFLNDGNEKFVDEVCSR